MNNIKDILKAILNALFSPKIVVVEDEKILVGGVGHAEDVYSESIAAGTCWTWHNVVKKNGGAGEIVKTQVLLKTTALPPRFTIYLFTDKPTCNLNDNVANTAPLFVDWDNYIDKIDSAALEDLGTGTSNQTTTPNTVGGLPLYFKCHPNKKSLFGVVVSRDALTPTALDNLRIRHTIVQY